MANDKKKIKKTNNKIDKRKELSFWQDGFTMEDYEKLTLGLLLTLAVVIASVKFIAVGTVDSNYTTIIGILASTFVARKAVSYFKPQTYYDNRNNHYNNTPYYSDNEETNNQDNVVNTTTYNQDTPI
jgi:hypothetical protein